MDGLQELKVNAKGLRILYVEDNDALRDKAAKLFCKFFTRVDVANNGKVALEKFKDYHYKIVITDIKMPLMDGIELSQRIRKMSKDTKIIIMSAFDDKEYLFKAIEFGVFRYLTKPINLSELTQVLRAVVDEIKEEDNTKLLEKKQIKDISLTDDTKSMMDLLESIFSNDAKIELHNYYKGLSITNDAVILELSDTDLTVSTSYQQQRAIQFEKKTYIVSEALPFVIESQEIKNIIFDKQKVELSSLKFVYSSPVSRSTIRVTPDDKHKVSLFLGQNKFHGDIRIEDLSLEGVRLQLNVLPAGLDIGSEVNLDMVLEMDRRPLIINIGATVFKKTEMKHSFELVFTFTKAKKTELVKYITKRQMATIREFKGMQNG